MTLITDWLHTRAYEEGCLHGRSNMRAVALRAAIARIPVVRGIVKGPVLLQISAPRPGAPRLLDSLGTHSRILLLRVASRRSYHRPIFTWPSTMPRSLSTAFLASLKNSSKFSW